jgi:type IV secretory pathway VirB4 component
MLNLAEYRNRPQNLADFLPWAALVAEGVVLNKDGSFQRTARFRGPDLDSATPAELVGTTARLNNALRRLGSGWAIFVEASRNAAQSYPQSEFPDPVSALVDAERKAQFEEAGPISRAPITSPSSFYRQLRKPRAPRPGSMRAVAATAASMHTKFSKPSSIAQTACCSSSRVLCRKPPGSPTKRR